jgi:hypothetical protein
VGAQKTDWTAIKSEYITGIASYRELALKYGLSRNAVCNKGKEEGWVELRRQHLADAVAETLELDKVKKVEIFKRSSVVSEKALKIIERAIDQIKPEELKVNPTMMKQFLGAIKDIKDILNIKGELDLREQQARINNLEKQAKDSNNDSHNITVTIAGGEESWAK